MMQVFRTTAKPILILLTISFFGWLVIDLSGITGGGGVLTRTDVGKVDGQAIDLRVYETAVQRTIEQQQRLSAERLGLEAVDRIRGQVFDDFVQAVLLRREYARRGITVADAEVVAALREAPPQEVTAAEDFQTDGRFDIEKYRRWLTTPAAAPFVEQLADQYRDQLLRGKLFRAVTADVVPSDAALYQQWLDRNQQVTVGVASVVPATAVSDADVPTTEADARAFYEANRERFRREATAYLSYVSISRLTDAGDTLAAFARAKQLQDEILGGAPFADVARRESADSVSAVRGGDLGEWDYGMMAKEFDEAAQRVPLGRVSDPVLSPFGVHLIQMESRTGTKRKGRHILVPIELAGAHRDRVDALADSLERLAAEAGDPAALDTVARVLGTPVERANPTTKGERVRLGLVEVPDAGVWAFRSKPGMLSPVVETSFAYFVFRLDSLTPAGIPPFDRVKGEARRMAFVDAQLRQARATADSVAARAARGIPLRDAATAAGARYAQFGPFSRLAPALTDPRVVGAAFGIEPGQVSMVVEAEQGFYVLQGIGRINPDSAQFVRDLPELRAQLARAARQDRVRNWITDRRDRAKIVDYREELYRTTTPRS